MVLTIITRSAWITSPRHWVWASLRDAQLVLLGICPVRCAPWGHSSGGKAAATQPQMPPAVPFALLSCHVSCNGPLCSQPYIMPVIPWAPTRVLSVPSSLLISNPFMCCLLEDGFITVVCDDSSCSAPQLLPLFHFLHTPVTSQSVLQHSPTPIANRLTTPKPTFHLFLIEMVSSPCDNFCMCHHYLYHSSQYLKAFKGLCFMPK